ncbi:hypothetical protein [Heyndrickxia ginsengihumi]|uniref:Uncharacterized protein n=1 Tax=Heyndrickxia ginsengihumi TaxID=363870 RepID=A0A0A6V9D3_9BACI|nr:hypothetical protein [Heyndrickxia ginsengihumi]KHD84735.1 hypothetical protein NG54_13560 [Heyndrickxia ginsengihumi]MBE6185393.1 hypothetical protein [Bacillus sp. (in: firmicutes)]MCM3023533.1 hypothetical protein [Heyndrickxia ginsengihumi]NEY20313.1 hypothetical protein [Heyndrickxia ginsengihumi]
MSRKNIATDEPETNDLSSNEIMKEDELHKVNRLLAEVLKYLSNDEIEEIDIEYLFDNTEGLRDWWDQYREKNRKQIEEEIKKALKNLPLNELEKIQEQINEIKQ